MSNFSSMTLQAMVDAAKRDLQSVINARDAAKVTKSPTSHWDARIKQTEMVLNAMSKELAEAS